MKKVLCWLGLSQAIPGSLATERPLTFALLQWFSVAVCLLFGAGLVAPAIAVNEYGGLLSREISIFGGMQMLYAAQDWGVLVILVTFTIVVPLMKLHALDQIVRFTPLGSPRANRLGRIVDTIGKWSMVDVFFLALLIFVFKGRAFGGAEPMLGFYLFAGGVVGSMLLTALTRFCVARASRRFGADGEQSLLPRKLGTL